jgi:phage host-nuclease inhibitor protein Gam
VPQNRDEANHSVAEIGTATREIARIEAEMNDLLAKIKDEYENHAAPYRERILTMTRGVQIWAEANRDELTQHGKVKTHDLPAGQVLWRTRPPSVRVTGAEAVLDLLRRMHLDRFIATNRKSTAKRSSTNPRRSPTSPASRSARRKILWWSRSKSNWPTPSLNHPLPGKS